MPLSTRLSSTRLPAPALSERRPLGGARHSLTAAEDEVGVVVLPMHQERTVPDPHLP